MALSNYTDISTALADWLNRSGFTDVTDKAEDFITLAQRRIQREIRIPPMEVVTTLTVDSNGQATVPTDYLEAKYLVAESSTTAWVVAPSTFIDVKKYQVSSIYSQPVIFDVEGSTIYVGAIPTNSETFTLVYYKELEFISTTVASNWFSQYAPELILYGAIKEAADFMKDWDLADRYDKKFVDAKTLLQTQKMKGEHAGAGLSVRAR